MRVDEELILTCAELATNAPKSWQRFLEAFERYAGQRRDELVEAQFTAVQTAQGKAKQCDELFKYFSACILTAEKIRITQQRPQRP